MTLVRKKIHINPVTLGEMVHELYDVESGEDSTLEADPDLKRSTKTCQGVGKMLTLYIKLHNKERASAVQTPLDKLFMSKYLSSQFFRYLKLRSTKHFFYSF